MEDRLRVIELFAGIGSQTQALKNIGVDHEVIAISEIDKYAVKSYEAMHGPANNLGDICKIEKLPQCDLMTYSFPCQDISVAGKGAGMSAGTRSGLLLEVERLLEVSDKPKYLLMENVKNLIGKKNKPDFEKWCEKLESMGYTNYWRVLNAKYYGVPQNRERIFMVSILGDHKPYTFPEGSDARLRLVDILEEKVDEKYYISKEACDGIISQLSGDISQCLTESCLGIDYTLCEPKIRDVANCLSARHDRGLSIRRQEGTAVIEPDLMKINECIRIGGMFDSEKTKHQAGAVWDRNGICPTLDTMQGGYRQPLTLLGNCRIRKLTPSECWSLMGFQNEQFQKVQSAGLSNTQLYKQAGNSIVVPLLEKIFENLFLLEDK